MFDCSKIGDFYDCGCADEEGEEGGKEEIDVSIDQGESGRGRNTD